MEGVEGSGREGEWRERGCDEREGERVGGEREREREREREKRKKKYRRKKHRIKNRGKDAQCLFFPAKYGSRALINWHSP